LHFISSGSTFTESVNQETRSSHPCLFYRRIETGMYFYHKLKLTCIQWSGMFTRHSCLTVLYLYLLHSF